MAWADFTEHGGDITPEAPRLLLEHLLKAEDGERAMRSIAHQLKSASIPMHPDWDDLKQTRDALDSALEQWLGSIPPDFLSSTMHYANTRGAARPPLLAGHDAFFQPPDAPPRSGDDAADASGCGPGRHRSGCAAVSPVSN